jgi:uncharacterized protein (TIGR00369 family)
MSTQEENLALVRRFSAYIPFNGYVGIEPVDVEPGFVRFQVGFKPELVGDPLRPALHGGVTAVLIDAAGGAAVWTLLTGHERISTIDMRVDYLLPARLETLAAEARVLRKGNHVAVASVRVYHPTTPEETIAEGKAVYNVRRASAKSSPPTNTPTNPAGSPSSGT